MFVRLHWFMEAPMKKLVIERDKDWLPWETTDCISPRHENGSTYFDTAKH